MIKKTIFSLCLLAVIACGDNEAASQPSTASASVELRNCSDGGGEASIQLDDGEVQSWNLTLYGSQRRTEVSVTPQEADKLAISVRHIYADQSEIAYTVVARRVEGGWRPSSMLAMDFAEEIDSDLAAVSNLHQGTVAAARQGMRTYDCQ